MRVARPDYDPCGVGLGARNCVEMTRVSNGEWEMASAPWLWWAIAVGIIVLEIALLAGVVWWFVFR